MKVKYFAANWSRYICVPLFTSSYICSNFTPFQDKKAWDISDLEPDIQGHSVKFALSTYESLLAFNATLMS